MKKNNKFRRISKKGKVTYNAQGFIKGLDKCIPTLLQQIVIQTEDQKEGFFLLLSSLCKYAEGTLHLTRPEMIGIFELVKQNYCFAKEEQDRWKEDENEEEN